MVTKFDLIEKELEKLDREATTLYRRHCEELKDYLQNNTSGGYNTYPATEEFARFAKDELYDYIITDKNIVHNEFLKRINYYHQIITSKEFNLLVDKLQAEINQIYKLINTEVIKEKELKADYNDLSFFIFE